MAHHDPGGAVSADDALARLMAGNERFLRGEPLRRPMQKEVALLLQTILPGLAEVDPQLPPQQQLESAVEANVRWSMQQLLQTPEGRAASAEGRMRLVGAVCELATGRVRLLA